MSLMVRDLSALCNESTRVQSAPVHVVIRGMRVRLCTSLDSALHQRLDDKWPPGTTLVRGDETIASLEKLSGGWGWLLRVKEVA